MSFSQKKLKRSGNSCENWNFFLNPIFAIGHLGICGFPIGFPKKCAKIGFRNKKHDFRKNPSGTTAKNRENRNPIKNYFQFSRRIWLSF
jgi:hypothetical protein